MVIFAASRRKGNAQGASVGEAGGPCGKWALRIEQVLLFAIGRLNLIHPCDRNMQRSTIPSPAGDVRGSYFGSEVEKRIQVNSELSESAAHPVAQPSPNTKGEMKKPDFPKVQLFTFLRWQSANRRFAPPTEVLYREDGAPNSNTQETLGALKSTRRISEVGKLERRSEILGRKFPH